VEAVLKKMKSWKAPGPDGIPNRLLKTLGKPLRERLAGVVEASLKRGYYPKVFRSARTVVLPKDKTEMDLPGSWRLIALLRTIGKTIEAIVAERLTEAVERTGRLPEEQMGNRKGRSYEDALKAIAELIGTAFNVNRPISMLALDISGAFDAVNHIRLLDVLRKKGLPHWLIQWVKSFLEGRSTTLQFDGYESKSIDIRTGVPQGSPLSPILFILYSSALYDGIRGVNGVVAVGFADDITLLSYGRTRDEVCE
jgi:hypothetical protein